MNRLIILAALLLSVVGGLTFIMSSSSPLAAQTDPSATRSVDSTDVEPGETVTVTITLADSYAGNLARITENLDDGLTYVTGSVDGASFRAGESDLASGTLVFQMFSLGSISGDSFSYEVTSDADGSYEIEGELVDAAQATHTIAATTITVSTAPAVTGPEPESNDLDFDVVSSKAVKGAQVSGVGNPIDSNPLTWAFDTDVTLADHDLGDFEIKETDNDNEFGLYVKNSGATPTGGSQRISVEATSTNDDGDEVTSTLRGTITSRTALSVTPPGPFTISQGISEDTLIGAFEVSGRIGDEYLDGILSGDGSDKFSVNDANMTLSYTGSGLKVETYNLQLTVSGDAGLANRTSISDVAIHVTASNAAPTTSGPFMATINERNPASGVLVDAGTEVGDASELVSANDGDKLTYSLDDAGDAVFDIDTNSGVITVESDILDGSDGDHNFHIIVSDGISANVLDISATVTVVANSGAAFSDGADDDISVEVSAGDVPMVLLNLSDSASDADGDDLTFGLSENPAHIVKDQVDGDDVLLLTYIPGDADSEGGRSDDVTVSVGDGWNDNPDDTISVSITVTELEPPAVTSEFKSITVAENTIVCSGDCSLADVVDGAVSYSIESGVDGGDTNYAVDGSTGAISVVNAPNYEDDLNPAFLVNANNADGDLAGLISVRVSVTDVNEMPVVSGDSAMSIAENAQSGTAVGSPIVGTDEDGDTLTFSVVSDNKVPFTIVTAANSDGSYSGQIEVDGAISIDHSPYTITVVATDDGSPVMSASQDVMITLGDINDPPVFDAQSVTTHTNIKARTIAENSDAGTLVASYTATDKDGGDVIQGVHFVLRDATDTENFTMTNSTVGGESVGTLTVASGANLEYDVKQDSPAPVEYTVEVNVCDADNDCNELTIVVTLSNSNDEAPVIGNADDDEPVLENSPRGTSLGDYSATDKDNLNQPGFDAITYTLTGSHGMFFQISDSGELMTLASLDYDRPVPCSRCEVTVRATDSSGKYDEQDVTITVLDEEDSVSTLHVTKANPVPGTEKGNPMSALSNTKTTLSAAVPERPADLPATYGSSPMNFVETEWANWGTVLRIAVTAESPDPKCGNGNQCVIVDVNSDSADDSLKLQAYRSADDENTFVAALMLVELSSDSTPGDAAVYKHNGGGVPALKVDEEDEVEVEFGNLRDTIEVENEAPEVSNFAPEHERAFDDADVDYTFTITDSHSGLPEPEDLPDNDGDADYTPVVALISKNAGGVGQCSVSETGAPTDTGAVMNFAAHIHEDDTLYCPGSMQDGEYVASEGGFGFAPIRDDKDFDEIDDGYDVETTIVLTENDTYYVTFIVCDNAGNCAYHDPDGNDDDEELNEITVDTEDPVFVEARTGLTWDSTDNEYDDNRSYIQVIFNDLTTLNPATVEVDDFVVEGHSIKSVTVYENPDDDDVDWSDSGRYAEEGSKNLRHIDRYRDLENSVFIELEDELLADETPDVTIVPNGVEDGAGNEQDDGDHEANDWISPKFTIVSITSTLETAQDEVLAGDGDEVTLVVTADERLDATRPTVTVTYVNADSVDTKGTASCYIKGSSDDKKGTRDRGEIVNNNYCQDSSAAKGGTLNNSVEKVSNTEWIVTVTEPKDTGYYSFRISGSRPLAAGEPWQRRRRAG